MPGSGMPEVLAKGPIPRRLENFLRNRVMLDKVLNDLRNSPDDLASIGYTHGVLATPDEVAHMRDEWFWTWWPQVQPIGPVIRKGLIRAMEVAIRDPDGAQDRPQHLPIDIYWVCHTGHGSQASPAPQPPDDHPVEVTVSWSEQQVTFIVHTPEPPVTSGPLTGTEPIFVVKRNKQSGKVEYVRP